MRPPGGAGGRRVVRLAVHPRTGVLGEHRDEHRLPHLHPRQRLHGGARIVAVATGITDAGGLRSTGAETVLDSLSDTETVLKALLA